MENNFSGFQVKSWCNDILINEVASRTNVVGKDMDNFYTLFCDGKEMLWGDFVTYELKNKFPVSNNDYIIALLLFGDGTLEFQLEKTDDAICWDDFSADELTGLVKHINKNE